MVCSEENKNPFASALDSIKTTIQNNTNYRIDHPVIRAVTSTLESQIEKPLIDEDILDNQPNELGLIYPGTKIIPFISTALIEPRRIGNASLDPEIQAMFQRALMKALYTQEDSEDKQSTDEVAQKILEVGVAQALYLTLMMSDKDFQEILHKGITSYGEYFMPLESKVEYDNTVTKRIIELLLKNTEYSLDEIATSVWPEEVNESEDREKFYRRIRVAIRDARTNPKLMRYLSQNGLTPKNIRAFGNRKNKGQGGYKIIRNS